MSIEDSETSDSDNEMEEVEEEAVDENAPKGVYLPGGIIKEGEELVHDPSAYVMLHSAQTGYPCLSFDVIFDNNGYDRSIFPHKMLLVSGTQSDRPNGNSIIVMRASNLCKTQKFQSEEEKEDESESDESDSDDEGESSGKKPEMDYNLIKHHGCVNRIRATAVDDRILVAAWSEVAKVRIFNITPQVESLVNAEPGTLRTKKSGGANVKPEFTYTHKSEGFGLDWSPAMEGVLASGDCIKNIHIWRPQEAGWFVDAYPLVGHTASVEDLQWSPNEPECLASCSVDKSLRIWDTRQDPSKACQLTILDAHTTDINVISWHRKDPLIVSGGDEGCLKIWDLRQFKAGSEVAIFNHHQGAVTSVEWCPTESTVFASSGADDQIAIWDLAVERDDSAMEDDSTKDLPPQLLFIHQGQRDIKELHWHPQIPGMVISTAENGFNFFKTISV